MGGGSHLSASHNREHAKVWDTLWNPLPLEESNPASVKPYRPKLIHLESCNQGFDDPSPKRATPLECRCIPAPQTARLFSSTQDHRLDWILMSSSHSPNLRVHSRRGPAYPNKSNWMLFYNSSWYTLYWFTYIYRAPLCSSSTHLGRCALLSITFSQRQQS